MSSSSWWDNNKETVYKATKATANATYNGAKTVSKAGYKTYKNHQANSRGHPTSNSKSNDDSTEVSVDYVRPLSSLQDVQSFPPPPLRAEQNPHANIHEHKTQFQQPHIQECPQSQQQQAPNAAQAQPTAFAPPAIPSRGPVPTPPPQQISSLQFQQEPRPTQVVQNPIPTPAQESSGDLDSFQAKMEAKIQAQINKQVQKQVDVQYQSIKSQIKQNIGIESSKPQQEQVQPDPQANIIGNITSGYNRAPAPIPPVAQQQIQPVSNSVPVQLPVQVPVQSNEETSIIIPPNTDFPTPYAIASTSQLKAHEEGKASITETRPKEDEDERPPTPLIASASYNSNIQVPFAPPPKHQDRTLFVRPEPKFRTEKDPVVKKLSPSPVPGVPPPVPVRSGSTNNIKSTVNGEESENVSHFSITGVVSPQLTDSLSKFTPPPKPFGGNSDINSGNKHSSIPPRPVIPSRSSTVSLPVSIPSEPPSYTEVENVHVEPVKGAQHKVERASIVGALQKDEKLDKFAPPPRPFRRPEELKNSPGHKSNTSGSTAAHVGVLPVGRSAPPPPPVRPNTIEAEVSTVSSPPNIVISQLVPPPKSFNPNIVTERTDAQEEELVLEKQGTEKERIHNDFEETGAVDGADVDHDCQPQKEINWSESDYSATNPTTSKSTTMPLISSSQLKLHQLKPVKSSLSTPAKPAIKQKPIIPLKTFKNGVSGSETDKKGNDDYNEEDNITTTFVPSQSLLRNSNSKSKWMDQQREQEVDKNQSQIVAKESIPVADIIKKKSPPPIKPKPSISIASFNSVKKTPPIIKPKPSVSVANFKGQDTKGENSSGNINYTDHLSGSSNQFFTLRKTGINLQDKSNNDNTDTVQDKKDNWESDKDHPKPIIPAKNIILDQKIKPIKPLNHTIQRVGSSLPKPDDIQSRSHESPPPPPPVSRGKSVPSHAFSNTSNEVTPEKEEKEDNSQQEEDENPFKRYLKAAVPKEDNHIRSRFP